MKKKIPNQGLLPALRPKRLKNRVQKLVDDARDGPLDELRYLANFTLHAGLIRSPFSGSEVGADGQLRLRLPDVISAPVFHRQALTWDDDRDAASFVEDLWLAVQTLIDALLEVFEKAVPKRFRR